GRSSGAGAGRGVVTPRRPARRRPRSRNSSRPTPVRRPRPEVCRPRPQFTFGRDAKVVIRTWGARCDPRKSPGPRRRHDFSPPRAKQENPKEEGDLMKTTILGVVLLLAIPLAAPAADSDLYGTWKLVSLTSKLIETGQVDQPRGKAPRGYLNFTPDGR